MSKVKTKKAADVTAKPGPEAGASRVTVPCPYCGGKAHRKAIRNIKGAGAYRRHYCVDGCGHYHYRTLDTNEVAEVGPGPRDCRLHPRGETKVQVKQVERVDVIGVIAENLGIDPASLNFTSEVDGRPRAIVLCLSEADIEALPTQEDRNTVRQLHQALLTVQACIKTYREQVTKKGKK